MTLDLSGVVLSQANAYVTLARAVPAWGADGRPTTTTSTIGPVPALVLPSKVSRQLDEQGSGRVRVVSVYAATQLRAGDAFTYGGYNYVVDMVAGYESTGNFCVALAKGVPAP